MTKLWFASQEHIELWIDGKPSGKWTNPVGWYASTHLLPMFVAEPVKPKT